MSEHTNQVAAMCVVCGRYLPVRAGVAITGGAANRFCHPECAWEAGDVTAANMAPVARPPRAHADDIGFAARVAAGSRPRLAAFGGVAAVLIGVGLLAFAGGDGKGANPVRANLRSGPDTEVLASTETTSTTEATSTSGSDTSAVDSTGAPAVPVEVGSGVTVTTRRGTLPGRPAGTITVPLTPAPGPSVRPPLAPLPSTPTTGPGTTRPPTTTTRPSTTTQPGSPTTSVPVTVPTTLPPTTQPPPTTTQPPSSTTQPPPTTTEPPPTTTAPPPPTTTEPPPTTTEPPPTTTAPPPTTELPPDPVTTVIEGLLGLLRFDA